MQYFFALGHQAALSLAEIQQVLQAHNLGFRLIFQAPSWLIADIKGEAELILASLGGTVKIAAVKEIRADQIPEEIFSTLQTMAPHESKVFFGLSNYDAGVDVNELGLKLKKQLKAGDIKARFVQSRKDYLSAVIVKKNKLLSAAGADFVIAAGGQDKIWLGRTIFVQDFEGFAKRDYGRPAYDDVSGMLPPKLSRMMLNLSGLKLDKNTILLDPFCGSGTVLMEASLLGAGKVCGTDISSQAIADAQKNLAWLQQEYYLTNKVVLEQIAVEDLARFFAATSLDLIVTEPYLGAPLKNLPTAGQAQKIISDLQPLYRQALTQMHQVLKPGGRLVMVFPFIGNARLPIAKLIKGKFEPVVPALDYKRPKQYIGREISVLAKI